MDDNRTDILGAIDRPLNYYSTESIEVSSSSSEPYTILDGESVTLRAPNVIINNLIVENGAVLKIDTSPYNYGEGADYSDL